MSTVDELDPVPTPDDTGGEQPAVVLLRGDAVAGSLVGGKAAALDRLIAWGFPVPPTAVVSVCTFRAVLQAPSVAHALSDSGNDLSAATVDAAFRAASIDPALERQILAAARQVAGSGRVAVRSSATVEDLATSSFAGQYRSVLDVDPRDPDELLAAVRSVWASLYHPSATAYRRATGMDDQQVAMGVVIMQMVPAVRAGVAFTQDPTGPPGTLRIEYVDGLADDLVGGQVTPSVVTTHRHHLDAGLPDDLRQVAHLAIDVERRTGQPQDVEWASDGTAVWIVQARPITSTAQVASATGPTGEFELTTAGIGEMLPGVLPPLLADIGTLLVEEGLRATLDRLGSLEGSDDLADRSVLIRCLHGRATLDLGRLADAVRSIPGAERRIRAQYFGDETGGVESPARRRSRVASLRQRVRTSQVRRRATFDAEVVVQAASRLRDGPDGMTDHQLLARHVRLVDAAMRGLAAELTVAADAQAVTDGLRSVLARYLPPDRAAHHAISVTVPTIEAPERTASAAVFGGPTWDELEGAGSVHPTSQRGWVDLEPHVDELTTELNASARWPRSGVRTWLLGRRIDRLAREATRQLARRERSKAAILRFGGEVRRLHREAGRRLAGRGCLADAHDVELLTVRELRSALLTGVTPEAAELDRRRAEHRRDQSRPPLPVRITAETLVDGAPLPDDRGERLTGWAVSGGSFVGTARAAAGPDADVACDEVLVAVTTDPSWAPLLMRCGAIVIEQGGPLSHAAIVAREFGVPAVFNIPGAVSRLAGHRIAVDGDHGVVAILDAEQAP